MFSVRIVDVDFYVTKPTEGLDVFYSEFREANVTRAPVLRVFGSTPSGQKTCVHVHQVFPYIFVPYDGTQPTEKYLKQFATSVDFAVQVALGKATSATKHVYKTEIVRRIPFYGYHENEQEFIKIEFYNPRMVVKVVDLLQNGAILNKIFQPYESHIPYILQFLIDYNLYGMNLLHARRVCFRGWSGMGTKNSQSHGISPTGSSSTPSDSSSFHASTTSWQHWNEMTIPSDLCLGQNIPKTSCCELEVDVIAEDILNQLEIGTSIGHNPGIAAMWEDEKQRRRDCGEPSQISIPVSQERGEMKLLDSEREFKEKIHKIIQERNQMIQSQLEVMEKSLSPEEFQELSQSILLSGKQPSSKTVISQDVDESIPVVDESVIEDILHTSQSQPGSLSDQLDDELVAILLSLAGDPNDHEPQECSPKANTSQIIMPEDKESDNEDEESIIMSQPIWNEDERTEDSDSASQSSEDEEDWKPQRIPQLDGPADDDASQSMSGSSRGSKKNKTTMNIVEVKSDSDGDDFRLKKKPKISGKNEIIPGLDKNISRKRRETVARKRKTARTQLDVLGGNTKQQDSRERSTIRSETATNSRRFCAVVRSEIANCNDGKSPSMELFHQSSKSQTSDKEFSVDPSVGRKRRCLSQHRTEDNASAKSKVKGTGSSSENEQLPSTNLKISKTVNDSLFHAETESSGSQTSDFELRLSDSSVDSDDFKKPRTIAEDFHKRENFYVAKQAPDKSRLSIKKNLKREKIKTGNTKLSDEGAKLFSATRTTITKDHKPSSGKRTKILKKLQSDSPKMHVLSSTEQGSEVGKASDSCIELEMISKEHSEKDTECLGSTLESRKRKRTRSKKATCLMFTHVGDRSKAEKADISERKSSGNSESRDLKTEVKECPSNLRSCTEFRKERSDDTILLNKKDSKEVRNEGNISRNSGGEFKKENKANVSENPRTGKGNCKGQLPGNRILLDACIRLERVSVEKLKYKNNTMNEHCSRDAKDAVSPAIKMKHNHHSSKLDAGNRLNTLDQMTMMSPRSARVGSKSPAYPPSSLNLNSYDQSLNMSPTRFSDKQNTLNDDVVTDVGITTRKTNVDFPIKFVGERDVRSITDLSRSSSEEEKLNITACAGYALSPRLSTVCDSFGHDEDLGMRVCKDVRSICNQSGSSSEQCIKEELNITTCASEALCPGLSTVCDSFGHEEDPDIGVCKDVRSISNQSVSSKEECIKKHLNITACASEALSPGLSTVCDSFGLEEDPSIGIGRDAETLSPGVSAACDSFSIGEELSGMNIQEVLLNIESPVLLENQHSCRETDSDVNKVIEEVEGPSVSDDQNTSNEMSGKCHHDSEKNNQIKDMSSSLHERENVRTEDLKFLRKQDRLDAGISTDSCHSVEHNAITVCRDSEKYDDIKKMQTQLGVDHQVDGTNKSDLMRTSISPHDFEKDDHSMIWRPATEPPSRSYVLETRRLYGLPHKRHVKAFCSDPKDAPSTARVIGGRRLQVPSLSVDDLAEFDLGGNFQTLQEFRSHAGDRMDNSLLRDCLRSLDTQSDNYGSIGIPRELKIALMGDHQVILTPVKLPPSTVDVSKWIKQRRIGKREAERVIEKRNDISPGFGRNEIPDQVEASSTPKDENLGNSLKHDNTHIQVSGKSNDVMDSADVAEGTIDSGESSQPTKRVFENISSVGPQHSTPVSNPGMKSRKCWQCTPIESGDDLERGIASEEKSCKIKNLRRNILNSQMKDLDSHHQPSPCEASYIEGPTPTNSFGFKISQPNIQVAKSVRQVQFLTLFSLELHIRTRKRLRPDPEFDPICGIFYHIEHETRQGKQYETGVIVARNESAKLRSSDADASTSSLVPGQASTSMETPQHSISGKTPFQDCLLRDAGISKELNIITEQQETDAINRVMKLVRDWDPDILLGFEVQMLSWGYLMQRASTLGIDLAAQLSRVQDSSGTARFDAEKDQWGASYTSEISITGRIVLNVWRLMKHEVTLNVYSFENISYHVLHERIPLYTFRQLALWWDQKLPHNRWRTVEHYVVRCQGNVRILNHVDFVNRTSEFARLYGILFYSVISRGSQFRVESMMLRLAKPMNYVAVSPSIQQRARMDAPECIPLVMEPESRFYTDPVVVLDFQSLYPSMMIAYNYCFSTCLGKISRLDKIGDFDFGCTSLNIPPTLLEKLENDIHVSANGSAFVKSSIRRGILPRMVEEILDTRVMVKKAMKEQKNDKVLGQLLDARQLGLKLIANVTYGYTSANFSGRMPCVEIADAIVRKARETLERAIHMVNSRKEWGARVVYGDTDSLFVLVKGATKEEAFKIGQEIVDAVTADNPKPVKLKFEKVYLPCVLQTKKRYVGYMYETRDQKEPVFDAKGIETVRRDTCPAVAKILEKSLRILFEEKDVSLVKKYVQRQFRKLMEEQVTIQDFIFAKEYRGIKGYKPKACVPALELARRQLSRDRRAEPRVGERVPYVVVNGSPGLPLIQLVRSPGDVLEDSSLRLNSPYYINKQILPPLNRVFSLIGIDVFTWYTELPRYLPRHHVASTKQKSSISRFFTTLHCPVCEQLTQQGLCRGCRDNPQKAVVMLAERTANWERKYRHLTEICFQCCGTRDPNIACVSLDCPVMCKRMKMKRNLEYGETLRDVQKGIEVMSN